MQNEFINKTAHQLVTLDFAEEAFDCDGMDGFWEQGGDLAKVQLGAVQFFCRKSQKLLYSTPSSRREERVVIV
jgi:hypothetical protein